MSGANTLAAMWATPSNDASQQTQRFEESPSSGVESILAASSLPHADKKGSRLPQLLQGCPSSHFLEPSMIQQHPIEWILQLLILFLAMHFQSELLNALSSNSYSSVQDSYLLLILLLIEKKTSNLLDGLYQSAYNKQIESLLKQAKEFGVSVFGDGATIKTTPLINALGAGVHNSFAMLEVFDCTDHCATGGKKDASYIANLFLPLITKLESIKDPYVSSVNIS